MRIGFVSWVVLKYRAERGDVRARRVLRRSRKRSLLLLVRRVERLRRKGFPCPRASGHKFLRLLERGQICASQLYVDRSSRGVVVDAVYCSRALPHAGDHVARAIVRGRLVVLHRWPSHNEVAFAERMPGLRMDRWPP
jgi:hypothetical protein